MATVYADASGLILEVWDNYQELLLSPPSGNVTTLDFDEDVFSALLADIKAATSAYRLTGGSSPVLTKNGSAVTVTAIPEASVAWQTAMAQLANIKPDQVRQTLTNLNAGTATLAQTEKALYFVILKPAQAGLLF